MGTWLRATTQLKTPTHTFADVGGLEEAKKQIRELAQANLHAKKFGQYGVYQERHPTPRPAGDGKNIPGGGGGWRIQAQVLLCLGGRTSPQVSLAKPKRNIRNAFEAIKS